MIKIFDDFKRKILCLEKYSETRVFTWYQGVKNVLVHI